MIGLFKDVRASDVEWWSLTGAAIGDTINQMFNKPKDFDPY